MNVTDEQKNKISAWVTEGLNLSQIQQKLTEEFDLKLTYMDTRFLVDDLGLELAEQKPPPPAPEQTVEETPSAPGTVSVSLDRITQPGAVASGSVTFSDGKNSTWALDQAGRLMLDAALKGYRPSQEDLEAFQQELARALESGGF
jgi:hypothetical protein